MRRVAAGCCVPKPPLGRVRSRGPQSCVRPPVTGTLTCRRHTRTCTRSPVYTFSHVNAPTSLAIVLCWRCIRERLSVQRHNGVWTCPATERSNTPGPGRRTRLWNGTVERRPDGRRRRRQPRCGSSSLSCTAPQRRIHCVCILASAHAAHVRIRHQQQYCDLQIFDLAHVTLPHPHSRPSQDP